MSEKVNLLEIETKRLMIVPYTERYAKDIYEEYSEEIATFQYPDPFGSFEETKERMNRMREKMLGGELLQYVILAKDGEFLGSAQVVGLRETCPEIGIWLKGKAHGNGYATESMKAILQEVKQQYGKEQVLYEVDRRNMASIHLVHKFVFEKVDELDVVTPTGKQLYFLQYRISS